MNAAILTTILFGTFGLLVALTLYGALVLWVLWGWFIVPLGVPQIGIGWAIGLALVAQLLTSTPAPPAETERNAHLITVLLKPALALCIGWVAKQFM